MLNSYLKQATIQPISKSPNDHRQTQQKNNKRTRDMQLRPIHLPTDSLIG